MLPTGDFGVRAAMKKAYNLPGNAEAGGNGTHRGGVASVLFGGSWYLWRSLENQGAMNKECQWRKRKIGSLEVTVVGIGMQ